jgi:plastocyanin
MASNQDARQFVGGNLFLAAAAAEARRTASTAGKRGKLSESGDTFVIDPVLGHEKPHWYRGDCHVHSLYSGGQLPPEKLAAEARAAGLDFLFATEHNTAEGRDVWARLDSSDLMVLFGQEVVTHTGHWLALGLDTKHVVGWDYGVRDALLKQQLADVHRQGGLCVAAHPHAPYPAGMFAFPYEGFDLVEVWNGEWSSDLWWQANNEAALAEWGRTLASTVHEGRWRPAIGNSDTHLEAQIGIPHTVVAAEALTPPAILAALRAGRTWIAESAAIHLTFTATAGTTTSGTRHATIGDRLNTQGSEVTLRVQVHGVAPGATVTFHTEKGTAHRVELPTAGPNDVRWQTTAAESGFVRVEVRHPDGRMAALTNPIILD